MSGHDNFDVILRGRNINKSFGHRSLLSTLGFSILRSFGSNKLDANNGNSREHQVLFDVDVDVHAGECLAVIGGSGSGKSTLTRILLGLEHADSGIIDYRGSVVKAHSAGLRALRRDSGLIYQDPYSSLDPRWTVADSVAEPLLSRRSVFQLSPLRLRSDVDSDVDADADTAVVHDAQPAASSAHDTVYARVKDTRNDCNSEDARAIEAQMMSGYRERRSFGAADCDASDPTTRVFETLARVGLDPLEFKDRYPMQLSGGQAQRVAIARALVTEPEIILADEPMSAIDVPSRLQILDTFSLIRKARPRTALIIVSHDLGVVQHIANRILVLHNGRVVETGTTAEVLGHPRSDYTRQLIEAASL